MKKILGFAAACLLLMSVFAGACAEQGKALMVFFSRAGENYSVGVVEKGNTAFVAEKIAELTGADCFEIVPENAYPDSYDEMLDTAQAEQSADARPAYVGDVQNWAEYDTVYLGYPIWWGDMPMIMYSFLESHDWTGKVICPFDTNEGSGLSGTVQAIAHAAGVEVREGLSVRGATAQNDAEETGKRVGEWIEKIGE